MRTAFSPGYNRDRRISAREQGVIQEAAEKRKQSEWREHMAMLSPTEISDLRLSLSRVQATGDSTSSVRAMRMIAVLDWFEDSIAQRQRLEKAVDGAGDLSDALQEFTDETDNVLKKDHAGNLADIFQDHAPENAQKHVNEYVAKELTVAREKVAEQVKALSKAVADHAEALKALGHDEA